MSRFIKFVLPVILPALVLFFFVDAQSAKKAPKGWLGIHIQELTPSLKESLKLGDRKGLLVPEVVEDSPADKAEIEDGDVILTFAGKSVELAKEFTKLVQNTAPGTAVKVKLFREGKELEVEVKIGKAKSKNIIQMGDKEIMIFHSRPRLGVEAHELNADLAPYFKAQAGQGVLLLNVIEDTPAAKAGLKAGDILLKVDAEATNAPDELVEALSEYEDGDEITLEYARAGKTSTVKVALEIPDEDVPGMMQMDTDEIFINKPGVKERKQIIIKKGDPTLKKEFEWQEQDGSTI